MEVRLKYFDNVKFLLITFVIIGHLADEFTYQSDFYKSIFLFIYAFHMPLFIFISGVFFSKNHIKEKIIFYLSIGFLYKITTLIIERLHGVIDPGFSLFADGGISWFMFALAFYTLVSYILIGQNKKFIILALMILAMFVGYDQSIGDYFYLSRVIVFSPFYFLGTVFTAENLIKIKVRYNHLKLLALLILLLWAILCFFFIDKIYFIRYLFTGRNAFYPAIMSYAPLYRLFCYFISFFTGLSILILVPTQKFGYISKMGNNSISVYFWHWNFYSLLKETIHVDNLFYYGKLGKLLFIFQGLIICTLLSQGGIFNFPIKQIKEAIYKYSSQKNTIPPKLTS